MHASALHDVQNLKNLGKVKSLLILHSYIEEEESQPEHNGFTLDVQVRRLRLFGRQHLDRPLQVEREGVQPQDRQRVERQLDRIEVGEKLGWRKGKVLKLATSNLFRCHQFDATAR